MHRPLEEASHLQRELRQGPRLSMPSDSVAEFCTWTPENREISWGILVSGEVKLQPSVIWAMLVNLTSVRTLHGSLYLPRPFILSALVNSCSIWILAWLMIPRDCSIIVVFQSHSFPCSKFTAVLHLPRGQSPGRWLLATFEIFELQKHRTWDQFSPACWHLLALVLSLGRCNLPFGQGLHQFQCHNGRGWKWQNLNGAATKYGYGSNLGRWWSHNFLSWLVFKSSMLGVQQFWPILIWM